MKKRLSEEPYRVLELREMGTADCEVRIASRKSEVILRTVS